MITEENKLKLWSLIEPLRTGFLVSFNNKTLLSRPMHLVQKELTDSIYFFTDLESEKVYEVEKNPSVCLTFGCPKTQTFVSISGHASINKDQELIDKFWNPFVAAWFPEGKEAPNVGLIQIKIDQAEIWDTNKNTVVQLFEYLKSSITKTPPNMGDHQKM